MLLLRDFLPFAEAKKRVWGDKNFALHAYDMVRSKTIEHTGHTGLQAAYVRKCRSRFDFDQIKQHTDTSSE